MRPMATGGADSSSLGGSRVTTNNKSPSKTPSKKRGKAHGHPVSVKGSGSPSKLVVDWGFDQSGAAAPMREFEVARAAGELLRQWGAGGMAAEGRGQKEVGLGQTRRRHRKDPGEERERPRGEGEREVGEVARLGETAAPWPKPSKALTLPPWGAGPGVAADAAKSMPKKRQESRPDDAIPPDGVPPQDRTHHRGRTPDGVPPAHGASAQSDQRGGGSPGGSSPDVSPSHTPRARRANERRKYEDAQSLKKRWSEEGAPPPQPWWYREERAGKVTLTQKVISVAL